MTTTHPLQQLDDMAGLVPAIERATAEQLEALRIELLGRKAGRLTAVLRSLGSLPADERRELGQKANQLRKRLEAAIAAREAALQQDASGPDIDWTMPARGRWRGAVHPVTRVVDDICGIFAELGFTRVTGPEAETEDYNFTKLNIALDHPAADMQDTFYLGPGRVLRTHTSPMQARTLERYPPPVRIVVPGRVYRRDAFDASHSPVFEQIEGLVVDEGVSFVDFKASIYYFVRRFFSPDAQVRFRPSFFPFTEPSAEVDVAWRTNVEGETEWLEIMGAGMVHPAVLENCGVDPERYSGFAFGMGPDRIAMLRYGLPDIRMLYQGDMRFLDQFVE